MDHSKNHKFHKIMLATQEQIKHLPRAAVGRRLQTKVLQRVLENV